MTHHYSIDALDQHLRAMDPDQLNKITAVAMQLSDRLRAQAGSPHPDERRRVWRDVNEIRADKPFLHPGNENDRLEDRSGRILAFKSTVDKRPVWIRDKPAIYFGFPDLRNFKVRQRNQCKYIT